MGRAAQAVHPLRLRVRTRRGCRGQSPRFQRVGGRVSIQTEQRGVAATSRLPRPLGPLKPRPQRLHQIAVLLVRIARRPLPRLPRRSHHIHHRRCLRSKPDRPVQRIRHRRVERPARTQRQQPPKRVQRANASPVQQMVEVRARWAASPQPARPATPRRTSNSSERLDIDPPELVRAPLPAAAGRQAPRAGELIDARDAHPETRRHLASRHQS